MLFPLLEQIELSPNGQTTLKIGGQSWHTRGIPRKNGAHESS